MSVSHIRKAPSPPPFVRNISSTENWCSTCLKMIECSYTWTIDNFSFYQEGKTKMLKSSLFSAGIDDELKWRLHLYPNGDGKESRNHLSIFLRLQVCDRPEITTSFGFSIIDAKGNKKNCLESERRKFKQVKDYWGSYGWQKFISVASLIDETNELLPNNKLTIFCEIRAFKEVVNVSGQIRKTQQFNVPACSLNDDIGSLLENKKVIDVMFIVSDEKFYAHKVILAARSPVFSAMFDQEINDQKLQLVNVIDVDKDAFAEMLRYIYTGKSPNLKELAAVLLVLAKNYGLDRLKIMCEEQLCMNLGIGNVADVLILADQHGAEQLKVQARDFIITHLQEVKSTTGFKKMTQYHPILLVEALSVLAMKVNGNSE